MIDDIDPDELAARVVELLRDPQLRGRLGERARRRAVRFSSTPAASTYAARLAEVVGAAIGRRPEARLRMHELRTRRNVEA